jgi:hypothetical protein
LTYPNQGYQGPVHIDPRFAQYPPTQAPPQQPQHQQGYAAAQGAQQYVNQQQPPGWQGQAPAPQQSAGSYVDDLEVTDPSRSGGASPSARHLDGRTILIIPKRVDETSTYGGQSRPTAYMDLYVLDGGPMPYGDSEDHDPAKKRPPTHVIDTPAFFSDVMIGNTAFAGEVRSKLGPDGRPTSASACIVVRGQKGNRPWMLTRCEKDLDGNERPDGVARREAVTALMRAHRAGQWTPPVPQLIANTAPPAGQGIVQYGPPQQQQYAQQAYAPQAPQQQAYAFEAGAQYGGPPPAAYQQPQQYAQQAQGWPMTDAQQAAPVSAPVQQQGMPPAPGWDPAQWANFTAEQQGQIWAQVRGTQQAGSPGVAGAQQGGAPQAPAGPGW